MTFSELKEGEGLRQGDICFIPGLPVWNVGSSSTQADSSGVLTHFVIPRHRALEIDELAGRTAVAVCSHDCDVENPRTRTGIIVAPLVKVPAKIGTSEFDKIMASGDVSQGIDYVHLFPVNLLDGDGENIPAVIDFSALVTLAKADAGVRLLASSARLRMDEEPRESFRTKLALFFARPYQQARTAARV